MVESECGAVAVGRTYLLPPLSSGGALLVRPWLRFHTPLIEPDMQICRIRLSDKTSRLRPRRAPTKPGEAYEPKVPVKVREGIAPALASPDLVLELEPPAQPPSRVVVERTIGFAGGADTEVIGPPAERAVQHVDELCGFLPATRSVGQRMDPFDHALDALLCRPVSQAGLACYRRVHPSERIPQEVKLPIRNPADPCLLVVHRQLQLAHDRAEMVQRRFGAAPSAQDHKIIRIGDEASAEALLKAELLPPQHKPTHVKVR